MRTYIEKKGVYVFAYLRFAYVVLGFSLAIIFIREYYLNRLSSMFYLLTRTRMMYQDDEIVGIYSNT